LKVISIHLFYFHLSSFTTSSRPLLRSSLYLAMLTIRQSLLSILFISLQHTNAQEGSVKTICTPAAYQGDPHLEYLKLIERSEDFCTKLVDAKFADTTTGYRDPVVSISYTKSPAQGTECSSQKKDDCLKNLKGLADICKSPSIYNKSNKTARLTCHSQANSRKRLNTPQIKQPTSKARPRTQQVVERTRSLSLRL